MTGVTPREKFMEHAKTDSYAADTIKLATLCAHGGTGRGPGTNQPIQPSIAQCAVFDLGSTDDAEDLFSGRRRGYAYTRFGNPTVEDLSKMLAAMEGGAEALVTSSGNAAVLCAVLMSLRGRAGPLVTHPDIYGGSFELAKILAEIGRVPVEFVEPTNTGKWHDALGRAGAVLIETPSNPIMRLIDLEDAVAHARGSGAPVIVDNTVATPLNQQPLAFGVDWVVHSTTKYLNGHSDMVGGCVISREPILPAQRAVHKNLGGTVNALDAWLVQRGMRTFALRMATHNRNGACIAEWLSSRKEIARVYYPGLETHPQATLFRKQMKHGGGLLSFELAGGEQAAVRFLNRLRLVTHAVSLGGLETLATRPTKTSHRGMTPEARNQAGISDSLIRLAVGIEDAGDIIADLQGALELTA
ncbi:MAG: aminotransferase class I/II-fold pyridoxal phosphate-dependent enzyme [Verrucomicrobia bacterium]|nr:aminotransferase class I/II-fold pyridoxal phosphate-dependent enzyme [Verrucomicrobiota bacterium]